MFSRLVVPCLSVSCSGGIGGVGRGYWVFEVFLWGFGDLGIWFLRGVIWGRVWSCVFVLLLRVYMECLHLVDAFCVLLGTVFLSHLRMRVLVSVP